MEKIHQSKYIQRGDEMHTVQLFKQCWMSQDYKAYLSGANEEIQCDMFQGLRKKNNKVWECLLFSCYIRFRNSSGKSLEEKSKKEKCGISSMPSPIQDKL